MAIIRAYDELEAIHMLLGLILCMLFWPFLLISAVYNLTFRMIKSATEGIKEKFDNILKCGREITFITALLDVADVRSTKNTLPGAALVNPGVSLLSPLVLHCRQQSCNLPHVALSSPI